VLLELRDALLDRLGKVDVSLHREGLATQPLDKRIARTHFEGQVGQHRGEGQSAVVGHVDEERQPKTKLVDPHRPALHLTAVERRRDDGFLTLEGLGYLRL